MPRSASVNWQKSSGSRPSTAPAPTAAPVGQPAPAVDLRDLRGRPVKLSSFRGKPTLLLFWFFLTPIIYPLSLIPPEWQPVMLWNPMHSFVQFYREAVLLGQFSMESFRILLPASIVSWLFGGWFFMRIRHAFGDVL